MSTAKAFKSSKFIKTGKRIFSRSFDGHRVDVLLPKEHSATTPVLVMHDGMNVLFEKYASSGDTWQVIEAIKSKRLVQKIIVIAVWGEGGAKKYNPRRINEFLCDDVFSQHPELWETLNPALTPPNREARGNYLMDLVADQILPSVAREFSIELSPKRTAIAGCSVAGVAAVYSVLRRPDIFGAALGFSSHWEFGGEKLIDSLMVQLKLRSHLKVWSDSGDQGLDAKSQPLNNYFGKALEAHGFIRGQGFETPTFWGTGHHETYWARRFEYPVNFWLKDLRGEN